MTDELAKRAPFFQHNRKLIRDIEPLEHKSRRPDVLVDDELIFAFYDSLIPQDVDNGAASSTGGARRSGPTPSCSSWSASS